MTSETNSELLTPQQVAELLEVSQSWLELRRRRGDGPPFIRLSKTKGVRYPAQKLNRWRTQRSAAFPGMSLRDYIAAKALQGLLAYHGGEDCPDEDTVEEAYFFADLMLKESNK